MDYEQKYKEALERARKLYNDAKVLEYTQDMEDYETIFPELKESKDEKIRKALITFFQRFPYDSIEQAGTNAKEAIAWLEKQGQEPKKVSIWKHWKNGIAGNGDGKPIYLIKNGFTYSLSSCLSFECDYIELSELDNLLLEKQGEQKSIMNVPSREVILSIWDLGNEWKKLTNGSISTEYGTQLDYIQKHWHESEYYLRAKQDEKKVTTIDFNAKDWYVSKVDGKIHNINISSEKQGEKKPINPNAIKDLERAILAAHPTFKQKPTWSGEDERMVEEILDAIEATEYEMAFNMSDVRQWLKNLKQRLS